MLDKPALATLARQFPALAIQGAAQIYGPTARPVLRRAELGMDLGMDLSAVIAGSADHRTRIACCWDNPRTDGRPETPGWKDILPQN